MDKRQRIVSILRKEYERAAESYRKAHAERVGMDAAANAWERFNDTGRVPCPHDDGVGSISQNPHSGGRWSEREQAAKLYASQMREAYEFVVDTFIGEPTPAERRDDGEV
jgi:hypothetical protein